MFRYEYVSVETERDFFGVSGRIESHRDVIDEYAKRGYKYIGYFPSALTYHGVILIADLIFEIEV